MDTLTILFVGLITHVLTDGGAQRAVLVNAPQHEARLIVDAADVIENRGFECDARGGFKLEGEHVMIDGIPAGDPTFEASYLRHVPGLLRISDGTRLIPEIETASPHEAVAAYVDLGAGTFSASDTYDHQTTFGNGRPECLARIVTFRAPAPRGEVAFVTASGKSLRVRGSATVTIGNDPPAGTRGTHFHMYAHILADATYVAEPVATGSSCGGGGRRRVSAHDVAANALSSDCSNTGCCP